jgi:hypothetical protein
LIIFQSKIELEVMLPKSSLLAACFKILATICKNKLFGTPKVKSHYLIKIGLTTFITCIDKSFPCGHCYLRIFYPRFHVYMRLKFWHFRV